MSQFGALLLQQQLPLLAVRDIHAGADIAGKDFVGRVSRDTIVYNPAILAISTPESILHFERLAGIKRRCVDGQTVAEVFRMDALSPAVAQLLLHTSPSEIQPAFVEVFALFSGIGHPDHYR